MLIRTDNRPLVDRLDVTWRSDMILTAEAVTAGERRDLAQRTRRGELERLRPGVYSAIQPGQREIDRHRTLVRALSMTSPDIIASHASAASLWRLPRLDPWPVTVEIAEPAPSARRNTTGVTRRRTSVPFDTEVVGGVRVTDLMRTALDLARTDTIASAVSSVDAALAGIRFIDGETVAADREAMLAVLDTIPGQRGVERARWVVRFADGLAELPGESLSRLQIHRSGLTAPILQQRFEDDVGPMFPDFWWPDFGVAGEMDGRGKYLGSGADFTRDAILREKRREDRMRRMCRAFVRWDWSTARNRAQLAALLRSSGVR